MIFRRRRVAEETSKILFEGTEPGTIIQHFKDDATGQSGAANESVQGRGVLINRLSEFMMTRLGEMGVPTHFLRRMNMREQLVRQVETLPLYILVHNVAAGAFAKRFGLEDGTPLPRSVVEFHLSDDTLSNPLVSEEHITAFGWSNPAEVDDMMNISVRVNDYLSGLFFGIGLRLVSLRLVFGRCWDNEDLRLVLATDLSPETCHVRDLATGRIAGLEDPDALWYDIAKRLGVLRESTTQDTASSNALPSLPSARA